MAEVVLQDYRQIVLSNATVSTSGSAIFDGFGAKELVLIINNTNAPTGTTPTITFSINEVDPGNLTTLLGNSATGTAISTVTTQIVDLPMMYSGTVQVSWTVTGTTPNFTGLYASLVSKVAGTSSLWNESGVSAMGTAGSPGAAVVSVQGVSGGTAIPISGTVTATNPSVGTDGSTAPTSSTQIGGTDGSGDLQAVQVRTTDPATNVEGLVVRPINQTPANLQAEVGGLAATGGAPSGNPVYIAGWDGTDVRALLTDTSGREIVVGPAAGGAAIVGNPVLTAPLTDNGLVGEFAFGEAYRLRVGTESLCFLENFDGTTVNTVRWTQSTLTMTQAQAQTSFDMNHNSTTTASTYSILTSTKAFMYTGEYAVECRVKAKLTPQTNATIELGFLACATTSTPTNGVFFRITSSGTQELVINFNGTETTSTIASSLSSSDYYTFVVYMYGTIARLDILNFDNSVFATTTLQIPATQGALIQVGHIPVAVRVYNASTGPGSAADAILTGITVSQLDVATNKAWESQLGDMARSAITDPTVGTQLQNFANSSAPSTIAAASLSNTSAAYTTLGGLFAFNTPTGAETDYILFAYQVPSNYDLLIWSVSITMVVLGVQSTTAPTVVQWGLAVGSSAVSLATGSPNPPIRQAIGMQQIPKSASIGDPFNPQLLTWSPRVPLVCYGGKYVHVILRVPSGNLTVGQINRGIVTIDGAFQ